MCGIAGFIDSQRPVDRVVFDRMVDTLTHRGPDDRGTFFHRNTAIGMRRLSIIDLSGGAQPMTNEDSTVWAVHNGEIYNHKELRKELVSKGHSFRTDHSDTEVLLHGYEEWGAGGLGKRLNGIYAFAINDLRTGTVYILRDRLGVKPLYYSCNGRQFVFASEIKALLSTGVVTPDLDNAALAAYLKYQFTSGEPTLLKGIKKLLPGHILEYRGGIRDIRRYWDFPAPLVNEDLSFKDAAEKLGSLLLDTVERQMMSDVPVGLFLSGGLDSSIIAYLMARKTNKRIKTYSIVFPGDGLHDESDYSSKVAREISSEHRSIVFDEDKLLEVIGGVIGSMDEPVADPAMIPTYWMSREAAKEVKVVLTGEGADEVFAGYPYYRQFVEPGKYLVSTRIPSINTALYRTVKTIRNRVALAKGFGGYLGDVEAVESSRLSGFPYSLPARFLRSIVDEGSIGPGIFSEVDGYEERLLSGLEGSTALQKALYVDTRIWLADDLMMKLDKMTMAHSLEGRVPFLDHRLVEFAFNLPDGYKIGPDSGKRVLKEAVKGYLPEDILNRVKHGFNVPLASWFRGRLKDFIYGTLEGPLIKGISPLRADRIRFLVDCHMDHGMNLARPIWILTVLCLWWDHIRKKV